MGMYGFQPANDLLWMYLKEGDIRYIIPLKHHRKEGKYEQTWNGKGSRDTF